MFLVRLLVFGLIFIAGPALAQSVPSPEFADGLTLCANYPNALCPVGSSPIGLNQAFTQKQNYPIPSSAVPGVGGVTFSGTPSAGWVPIGTGATTAVWAPLPGSFSGFANPTAQIGLTTINGSATTAMRSDAAPALSQGITPVWTGLHIFGAGLSSPITESTPLAQTAISKLLSGAPASSGSSSLYNAISSSMINDTVQPNDGVSLFNENGGPYYGAISSGVTTPQRGTVAALQLGHQVYNFADAPTVTGGEPTGISLILNALTNMNNGSANYWLNDFVISGPASNTAADREGLMVGYSLNYSKMTPGNTVVYGTGTLQDKLGAYGIAVQTAPGLSQRFKSGSDTWVGNSGYPLNAGLVLSGYSGAYGTATDGYSVGATAAFLTAIQIGGWGGAYWNWGTGAPVSFTGTSTGTSLAVTGVSGSLFVGNYLIPQACVPTGTYITVGVSGGGAGTYTTNQNTTCSGATITAASGTPYHSYIQDGIDIQDHAGDAIHILARHPVGTGNAIVVDSGAGPVNINSAVNLNANITLTSNTIFGGTAANADLVLTSTSNVSPSGDIAVLRGSQVLLQTAGGISLFAISGASATLSTTLGIPQVTWTDTQTCTAGQISVDASYIYVCTATNTVKRAALSGF